MSADLKIVRLPGGGTVLQTGFAAPVERIEQLRIEINKGEYFPIIYEFDGVMPIIIPPGDEIEIRIRVRAR